MAFRICALTVFALPVAASAALNISLATTPSSPQPVGTSISITATVNGDPDPSPAYLYSFSIAAPGQPADLRRGFARSSSWVWTPNAYEGVFTIFTTVKNTHSLSSGTTSRSFTLTTRLVNGLAAVNSTSNPLVAFFSGPSCQIPNAMRVRYTPVGGTPLGGISTSGVTTAIRCRADVTSPTPTLTSMNFYVGGLYPNITYNMHWEVLGPAGNTILNGRDIAFTAGPIPASVFLPTFSPVGTASNVNRIILNSQVLIPFNGHVFASSATDTAGNVLWYSTNITAPVRLEFGGSYWGFVPGGADTYVQGIRQVDLAGNAIVETTVGAVNEQLVQMRKPSVRAFHHEVRRIYTPNGAPPGGNILVLASLDQSSTTAQGGTSSTPVDIIGDAIIVLDHNFNVKWMWNAFDFLDINQTALLGEQCQQPGSGGCEPFNPSFAVGNDWLHSNSVQYTAYDGNLVMSMRHQDAVIKIAYENGNGDGHIIWKLGNGLIKGKGGAPLPTMTLTTSGTIGGADLGYPSFSHQHDAEFELSGATIGGSRLLTIFDDGNRRQATFNPNANSRCQLWAINESTRVANLNLNVDVGSYSFALGSAQRLPNGHLVCDSGIIGRPAVPTDPKTETTEADAASGNVIYTLHAGENSYRTFRLQDMDTPDNP